MLPAPIQPILRALVAFLAVILSDEEVCSTYVVEFAADDLLMRFRIGAAGSETIRNLVIHPPT